MVMEPDSSSLQSSWSTDDTGLNHTPYITVLIPRGEPELKDIPMEPGEYILSAQVCMTWRFFGDTSVPNGVSLYTPAPLIFPGQPGHPGDGVKGPVAPGLVMRYSGASRRWM